MTHEKLLRIDRIKDTFRTIYLVTDPTQREGITGKSSILFDAYLIEQEYLVLQHLANSEVSPQPYRLRRTENRIRLLREYLPGQIMAEIDTETLKRDFAPLLRSAINTLSTVHSYNVIVNDELIHNLLISKSGDNEYRSWFIDFEFSFILDADTEHISPEIVEDLIETFNLSQEVHHKRIRKTDAKKMEQTSLVREMLNRIELSYDAQERLAKGIFSDLEAEGIYLEADLKDFIKNSLSTTLKKRPLSL
ncbi:MAG TPA: hypothetical protein VD999_03370 [Vitreimonas sp.]|nr:hypothetical protein [Vitreimonas sp.]